MRFGPHMLPGRLVPAKTRLFVDVVVRASKAGWSQ